MMKEYVTLKPHIDCQAITTKENIANSVDFLGGKLIPEIQAFLGPNERHLFNLMRSSAKVLPKSMP